MPRAALHPHDIRCHRQHPARTVQTPKALPAPLCMHTLVSSRVSAPTLQSIHTRIHPRNHALSAYPPTRLGATDAPTPYQPAAGTPCPHHYTHTLTHKHTRAEEALDRDTSGSLVLAETGEDDWEVAGSARAPDGQDARHEEADGIHEACRHLVAAVEYARQDLQVEDKNKGAKDDTDLGEQYAPTVPINCRRAGAKSAESVGAPSAHTHKAHRRQQARAWGAALLPSHKAQVPPDPDQDLL